MVEKPKQGTAPSNLIISGRYILQPGIFEILERVEKGAGGEIQLTDGMIELARTQSFHGARFDGRTYDCGSKLGFLKRQPRLRARPQRHCARAQGGTAPAGLCPEGRLSPAESELAPDAGVFQSRRRMIESGQ